LVSLRPTSESPSTKGEAVETRAYAETGIKSYEFRMNSDRSAAIRAAMEGDFVDAIRLLTYCQGYKSAIEELKLLEEEAEVEG